MGQFDDLTPSQGALLCKVVEASRKSDVHTFRLLVWKPRKACLQGGLGESELEISGVPDEPSFYEALGQLGYVYTSPRAPDGITIDLLRRAFDYATYARRSHLRGWLQDWACDLGQDRTLRSKIMWTFWAVVISQLGVIGMKLLGWL